MIFRVKIIIVIIFVPKKDFKQNYDEFLTKVPKISEAARAAMRF